MRRWILFVALSLCLVLGGCATTQMETARQLETGDVVASGSATMPGAAFMPRFNGALRLGLPHSDVGGHLASSFFTYAAGLGVRIYPIDLMTLSLQGDLMIPLLFGDGPLNSIVGTINPRLSTSTDENRFVYGGIETPVRVPISGGVGTTASAGVFGGIDFLFDETGGLGMQAELAFRPLFLTPNQELQVMSEPSEGDDPQIEPMFQVSIGIHYHWLSDPPEEEPIEPTPRRGPPAETPQDDLPPPEQPDDEPEEEPSEPTPDYDDRGVPVY